MKISEKRFHYIRISVGKTEVCRFIELKTTKKKKKEKKRINYNPQYVLRIFFRLVQKSEFNEEKNDRNSDDGK